MAGNSIKKNYVFNVSYQILTLITPLITAPYLSRVLEADGIGTVSFAESIVSYFSLFAAVGINIFGQREISYVQKDIHKRSQVFWNTKCLEFITSGITIMLYLVFVLLQRSNTSIFLILVLNLISVFFDITWFFQGMEEFGKTVTRNAVCKLLQILYIFILVKQKEDILLYVLGLGLFALIGNLSLWAYMPKYIESISIKELCPFKDTKIILSLFVPTIAIHIYAALDKTMIGLITGSSFENGYYEQAMKISKMLLAVVTALGTVMIPRIGNLFGNGNHSEVRRLMYRGYRFVWFLGIPLSFGLIVSAGNFVPWFFGPGFEEVIPVLRILSLLILAIGINNVTGMQYLIPTKRQNAFTFTVILGACTNICLNCVLIYMFRSKGAAIASVAAESVVAVSQLVLVRKELSALRIIKEGVHYMISGTIMVVVIFPITLILSPSMLHSIIIAVIGAFVYFAVLGFMKDEFLVSNIKQIFNKLLRK